VVTIYGKVQRDDKAKYYTQYNTINAANDTVAGGPNDIQLAERSGKPTDPWDTRPLEREPSVSNVAGRGAAAGGVLPPGAQAPRSRQATMDAPGYADAYGQGTNPSYNYNYGYGANTGGYDYGYGYADYPAQARVAPEQPTPHMASASAAVGFSRQRSVGASDAATLVAPEQSKYHPGECDF
jgi:hypothetical protein